MAYRLEPDLKDGHGGIRDVQSLRWAQSAGWTCGGRRGDLARCYDVLLRARVALHLATERPGDALRLEDQDSAAAQGGWKDADDMMASIAMAGRTVAWLVDENWDGRSRARTSSRTGPSRRASCCSTARSSWPTERIPPRTRRSSSPRRWPRPVWACASDGSRSIGSSRTWRVGRASGRWAPVPNSSRCCSRATRHPGARGARPARAARTSDARNGSRSDPARSATPTTASPSTVTCGRRPPTPPSSPTASAGRTCSWSARCSTTSARAIPATTPSAGMSWSRVDRATDRVSTRATSTCWWRWCGTTCCSPTSRLAATSTDPATIEHGGRGGRRPSTCSTCCTR